jgi:hypothetical protein
MARSALVLAILLGLVGCKNSICARRSDCADGLTCTSNGVCGALAVDAAADDGGGIDAARIDAAPIFPDGGADAAQIDAGVVDAAQVFFDAPEIDGGP